MLCGLLAVPAHAQLAAELFAEGDWVPARREALRELAATPDDARALLVAASSALRIDPSQPEALAMLDHLAHEGGAPSIRAAAACERGRAWWASGDESAAATDFSRALRADPSGPLATRAACALWLLDGHEGVAIDPALRQQAITLRPLFAELRGEVAPPAGPRTRIASRPAEWIVGFYKAQIAPAIGHRCSLHPSCSQYFLEASRAHGWLGVPLIGDRLVREPGVVSDAEVLVQKGERTLVADPLADHVRTKP